MIHMKGKSSLVCILNCVLNSEILSKKGRKIHSTASNSFEALLQRSCRVEYACWSNISGTTTEWRMALFSVQDIRFFGLKISLPEYL
ncbi:hypothetical protein TNCV_4620291 [Trichonephila clavipes]|nr:hypothetical protein TNCV_4620291 [Trichonephila clavipes]